MILKQGKHIPPAFIDLAYFLTYGHGYKTWRGVYLFENHELPIVYKIFV